MSDSSTLWAAVKLRYDVDGLVSLTNIRDRSESTIDDIVGTQAAASTLNLWPVYAQVDYDTDDDTHVEVASFGVIATLWRRGGQSSTIEQVKWDQVFGDEGMIARVRRTGPRGRAAPVSNSGVSQKSETVQGRQIRGWSDPASLPINTLPQPRIAGYGR